MNSFKLCGLLVGILMVFTFTKPLKATGTVQTVKGLVYDKELTEIKNGTQHLFEVTATTVKDGEKETLTSIAKHRDGKEYSRQVIVYQNNLFQKYTMENKEQQISTNVFLAQGKIHYEFVRKGERTIGEEGMPENFLVGPAVNRFVKHNASHFVASKEIEVQIGVPSRASSIGFKLFQVEGDEKEVKEGKWKKIRMKPSNFFIAALVPPIHYFIDNKTGEIAMYSGLTEFRKPESDGERGFAGTIKFLRE